MPPQGLKIRRMSKSRRPVISPLDEEAVFSDSDEEMEYVQEMNKYLTPNEFLMRRKHVGIQCNINENLELKDILKLLSTYRFENAMISELKELVSLLKWLSMKYNLENVSPILSSGESGFESTTSNSHVNHQQQKFINSKFPVKQKKRVSWVISDIMGEKSKSSSGCTELSSLPKKRERRPREYCLQLGESEKEIYSEKLSNIFVEKAESMSKVSKSGIINQKESKVTDIGNINENSNTGTFKKPYGKVLKSIKPKSPIKSKLLLGQKINHSRDESIRKKSGSDSNWSVLDKSSLFKEPLKINQSSNEPIINQSSSDSDCSLLDKSSVFENSLNLKSLARNWMKSRHSFSCDRDNPKVIKPHFMSFQSHLKRRRLHSTDEWLNSREFKKQRLLSIKYNIENVSPVISSGESGIKSTTSNSDVNNQQEKVTNTKISMKQQKRNSEGTEEAKEQKSKSSSRCTDLSSMQKDREQRPREYCLQLFQSEKEIHSKNLPDVFVEQAESTTEVSKSGIISQKESKITDIDNINENSNTDKFKKPYPKVLKSMKSKSSVQNKLFVDKKFYNSSNEHIRRQSSSDSDSRDLKGQQLTMKCNFENETGNSDVDHQQQKRTNTNISIKQKKKSGEIEETIGQKSKSSNERADLSSMQKKREKSEKEIHSKKIPNDFVDKAESATEVSKDGMKNQTESKVTDIDNISDNLTTGIFKKPFPKVLKSAKPKSLIKNKLLVGKKVNHSSDEPIIRQPSFDSDWSVSDSEFSFCDSDWSIFSKSSVFEKPLNVRSLGRNWMKSRHSFSCDRDTPKVTELHYMSFQDHLERRRLHSPNEWLNSRKFKGQLLLTMKYNLENVSPILSSGESGFEATTSNSDVNHQQQKLSKTKIFIRQQKKNSEIEETIGQKSKGSSKSTDLSSTQNKRGQRSRQYSPQLTESEQEIPSKKLHYVFVEKAESVTKVSKSGIKNQKEATDSDNSSTGMFKKPYPKVLKSIKAKAPMKNKLLVGMKINHSSDEPVRRQSSSDSDWSSSNSDWPILDESNVFEKPLNVKSLARNWMKSGHSFSCVRDNPKVAQPHYMSFQSQLKRRRLHSPTEWLNSREFQEQLYI